MRKMAGAFLLLAGVCSAAIVFLLGLSLVSLFGAVSLLLLGGGVALFLSSGQQSKAQAAPLAGQPLGAAMNAWAQRHLLTPIEARVRRWHYVALVIVMLFLLTLGSLAFLGSLLSRFTTGPDRFTMGIFFLMCVLTVFLLAYILSRFLKYSLKTLEQTGVVRSDGRRFAWSDFIGTVERYYRRRARWVLTNIELIFAGGKVVIYPAKLKNSDEILRLVASLPGERKVVPEYALQNDR